jgi:hypothetical protein
MPQQQPWKLLIRAPDGALYLVSTEDPPRRLTQQEENTLVPIIEANEGTLANLIEGAIPALGPGIIVGVGVHCGMPEELPE